MGSGRRSWGIVTPARPPASVSPSFPTRGAAGKAFEKANPQQQTLGAAEQLEVRAAPNKAGGWGDSRRTGFLSRGPRKEDGNDSAPDPGLLEAWSQGPSSALPFPQRLILAMQAATQDSMGSPSAPGGLALAPPPHTHSLSQPQPGSCPHGGVRLPRAGKDGQVAGRAGGGFICTRQRYLSTRGLRVCAAGVVSDLSYLIQVFSFFPSSLPRR